MGVVNALQNPKRKQDPFSNENYEHEVKNQEDYSRNQSSSQIGLISKGTYDSKQALFKNDEYIKGEDMQIEERKHE